MTIKVENIFFAQGDNSEDYLSYLEENGEEETLKYLIDIAYYPGEHLITEHKIEPFGSSSNTFRKDNFVLSYNNEYGYIGLNKIIL